MVASSSEIVLPAAHVNLTTRRVARADGRKVRLTEQESDLLAYLAARPGRLVSRAELLERVWRYSPQVVSRAPDVAIHRLRVKLEAVPNQPVVVRTSRGGWVFHDQQDGLPPCPLIGRDEVWEELLGALSVAGARVQLSGPPGSGLRALAEAAVAALDIEVVRVIVAADLGGGDLVAAVATALGVPLTEGEAAFHSALAETSLLWLDDVDGAESAIEAAAGWNCRVLVTGGRPVTGAAGIPVPPLSDEHAIALARAELGDAEVSDDALARLVHGLDGLPLAIALAARRARVVGVEGLLDAGGVQYDRVADRGRGRTLHSVLATAWRRLPERLARALCDLAPLADPFDLGLAELLLDPASGWAGEQLEDLVEAGWVRALPGPRYELLSTLRWLALGMAPPRVEVLQRLIERVGQPGWSWPTYRAVLAVTRELLPGRVPEVALAVEAAVGDLLPTERHAALLDEAEVGDWALEARRRRLGRAWRAGVVDASAGMEVLRDEADRAGRVDVADRIRVDLSACRRASRSGSEDEVAELQRVLERTREPADRVTVLRELAELHMRREDWREARVVLRQAMTVNQDPVRAIEIQCTFGQLALLRGRPDDGLEIAEQAAMTAGDGVLGERAWRTLAGLRLLSGDIDGAGRAWEVSLELCRRLGLTRMYAVALGNLGLVALEQDRLDQAQDLLEEAIGRTRELGQERAEAAHVGNLGFVFLLQGELRAARRELEECERLAELCGLTGAALYARFGFALLDQLDGVDVRERLEALHAELIERGDVVFAQRVAAHLGDPEARGAMAADCSHGRVLALVSGTR